MKAATHLTFAGLTGVVCAGFGASPDIAGGAALAVGALLPDIDTTHSGLGKFCKPLSGWLERRYGHRTITHSLLGMAIVAVITSPLLLWLPSLFIWLQVGIFTHLILDTANIVGVPLLYPYRLQFWMVHNRSWRVPYNSPKEFAWLSVICVLCVVILPFSLDGFSPWFHRMMGTPYGAVEDYLSWRDNYEVWAEIKGHNLVTDEDVNGRFRIIDALNTEQLLVEDEAGRAFSVGLGRFSNIVSTRISTWRGLPIASSHYRLDVSGRLVSDLINSLPKGARRVYVNAHLALEGDGDTPPTLGYFERVQKFGNEYEVRSATAGDLAHLSHLVISGGSVIVRAEYSPDSEALANIEISHAAPAVTSHILPIPNLPDVSGLVVGLGDEIAQGELIARYVDDDALTLTQEELEAARAKIPELQEMIELEEQAHLATLASIREQIASKGEALERIRYLVERGSAPRVNLTEAEAQARQLELNEQRELTNWTSRLNTLNNQLRDANLTIAQAEREQQAELESQWVRAPIAGVVSDIRVTAVNTKGINLEVMIIETAPNPDGVTAQRQDCTTAGLRDCTPERRQAPMLPINKDATASLP